MNIKRSESDIGPGIQAAEKALDLDFLLFKNDQYNIMILKEYLTE